MGLEILAGKWVGLRVWEENARTSLETSSFRPTQPQGEQAQLGKDTWVRRELLKQLNVLLMETLAQVCTS